MHQTVNAAKVYEYTVRSDVLHRTLEYLTFFETTDDHALLLFELCFDQGFVRNNHVLELLVDLDNFEIHLLSDVHVEVTNWFHIYL